MEFFRRSSSRAGTPTTLQRKGTTGDQVAEPAVGRVFQRSAYGSLPKPNAETVELCLECSKLPNLDVGSLSDPFAVLYERRGLSEFELGTRTETVWDDLNPKFVRCWYLNYFPPSITDATATAAAAATTSDRHLRVEIYDRDNSRDELSLQDFIGSATFKLSDVMSAPDRRIELDLRNASRTSTISRSVRRRNQGGGKHKLGTVTIMTNPVNEAVIDHIVEFRLNAAELRRRGIPLSLPRSCLGQFFTLSRRRLDATGRITWTPVYRSEVATRAGPSGYIKYQSANVTVQTLNNGEAALPLRLEFWQREVRRGHERIGFVDLTLARLQQMAAGVENRHVTIEGEYADQSIGHVFMAFAGTQGDNLHSYYELNVRFESTGKYDSSVHAPTSKAAANRSSSGAEGLGSGVMNAM